MKNEDVLDYMEQLESENDSLNDFSRKYDSLASFLADYEFLKDKKSLSQKDVAKKMGTTQSAVSRIERFKTNPSYFQLKKMSEAVGGELFISPLGNFSLTVPVDLHEKIKSLADKKNESIGEYLQHCIRESVQSDYEDMKTDVESVYYASDSISHEQQYYSEYSEKEEREYDDCFFAA